jgi:hypothetical protein
MAQLVKKVKVANGRGGRNNPRRKSAGHKRPNRPAHVSRPTNAAAKKGNTMARTKKKTAANSKTHNKSRGYTKNKNPRSAGHRRRRRNPDWIGTPKEVLTSAVAGLGAAVLTRQIPQMVLTTGNTGIQGYFANAVVAAASAWLAGKFAGPTAGKAALVGGSVILLDRVLTEQVSPIGPYLQLSGVGDATAMTHMGTVRTGWYTHPGLVDPSGNLMAPDPYTQQAVAAVLAAYPQLAQPIAQAAATTGHSVHAVNPSALRRHVASGQLISSRFQGRFNQSLN